MSIVGTEVDGIGLNLGSEVDAIVGLVGDVNSSIHRIRRGWFTTGKDIEVYSLKARNLSDRITSWTGLIHSRGLETHQLVKPILEQATTALKSLEKEAAYLKDLRHRCCMRYKSTLLRSVIPRDLSSKLKKMGNALATLQAPGVMDELNQKTGTRALNHGSKAPKLAFFRDAKYCPIQGTVDEVVEALVGKDRPHVVILSGEAGTGKTALVRDLALAYQEHQEKRKCPDSEAVDVADGGRSGNGTKFFNNGIVYVPCGCEADSKVKIAELLCSLGSYSPLTAEEDESRSYSEDALRERLCTSLEKQDLLVILDDVWESAFLQRLLVPGKKVKYLVTTQDSGLSTGDYSSRRIVMKKPHKKGAETIFLNHIVDSLDGILSSTLREAVENVLEEVEDNPLVMKNLAVAISGLRCTGQKVAQWQSVLKKFRDSMAGQDARNGLTDYDAETRIGKEVLCSFELAMESILVEAQHLLLLASQCEGPLVPGVVIKMLHTATSSKGYNSFSNLTNYLEKRGFIRLQDYERKRSCWSLESAQYLSRKFAKSEEEMTMLTTSLLANNAPGLSASKAPLGLVDYSSQADSTLVAALCFVYGEKNLSAKAATKLTIMTPTQGRGLLRLALEPVVWLLHVDHEIEEEWEQKAYWSARAVLIKYTSEGVVDDEAASTLLSIPESAPAMCRMLQIIGETGERSILTADTPLSTQALLKLLRRDVDKSFDLQRIAAQTLGSVADKSYRAIFADPSSLEKLVQLLAKDVKSPAQAAAALAIGKLAMNDDIRLKIASCCGILPRLLSLLEKDEDSQVQEASVYAIARLSVNSHNVSKIADYQPTLTTLSAFLGKGTGSAVQVQAARALANLARLEKVALRIAGCNGVLNALVLLCQEDICSAVRLQASRLIKNLSACQDNHSAICSHPGVITAANALLKPARFSCDHPHPVALVHNGVGIFAHLSAAKDCRTTIVETPGAIKHLLALVGNDPNSQLHMDAAKCLSNVALTVLKGDHSLSSEECQALAAFCNSDPDSRPCQARTAKVNPEAPRVRWATKWSRFLRATPPRIRGINCDVLSPVRTSVIEVHLPSTTIKTYDDMEPAVRKDMSPEK
ncbi:hypothetical protein Mapa_012822 [Marchantia paleacea]|nr:hypothetical protein Mapa_012822 [Marchantia paleacea]